MGKQKHPQVVVVAPAPNMTLEMRGAIMSAPAPTKEMLDNVPTPPPEPQHCLLASMCSSNCDFSLERARVDIEGFFHSYFKWFCDVEFGPKARYVAAKSKVVKTSELEHSNCSKTYNTYVDNCKKLGKTWSVQLDIFVENHITLEDKEIEDEL